MSIREYAKLDSGEVVPTKKGIFLTEENYKAVMGRSREAVDREGEEGRDEVRRVDRV